MTTPARTKPLTAEEFYRLPDPEHGGKMELVRGEVVIYMPVSMPHGTIASRIDRALGNFADEHDLGAPQIELGFRVEVEPDVVRVPDVAFMTTEQMAAAPKQGFVPGAPTLAVEVKSPDNSEPELVREVGEYLVAGSTRVWIVRPERRNVTVYRDDGGVRVFEQEDDALTSDDAGFAVEGFELPLHKLFR